MRVLVVGYGSIGRRHITNLSRFTDVEITVCTKRKFDRFLNDNRCKVVNSIQEAVKKKPDIAIISNATSFHIDTAIKLAKYDVNLLIEKPLSHSSRGLFTLLKIVKNKKLVTLIGCNLRFHPCIIEMKKIIETRKIGKIISIHVENGSYLPSWHPNEDYRNGYAARRELGGGVLLTSIHEIDYLYWFFGKPKEVFSITGKFSDLDLSVDDLSIILLRFKDNIIAEVHLDYFQKPSFRSCKVIGTRGTIYWDSDTNVVKVYDINKMKWVKRITLTNYNTNETYVKEIEHFMKCVMEKKTTINPVYDGIKVMEIALAAKKSSDIKKVVKIE